MIDFVEVFLYLWRYLLSEKLPFMKQFLFFLATFFTISSYFSTNVFATHYMGGEITWECIPSGQNMAGQYIFTMKIYRECYTSGGNSAAQFGSTVTLMSNSPAGSISMTEVSGWPKDISPVCNPDTSLPHLHCTGMPNGAGNMGACQEHVYKSAPVKLNGVPPATGWIFYWGGCCRNGSANIYGQPSFRLRAMMYPYGTQNAYPCFDNSPTFAEVPRTVIGTGYEFSYNNMAFDPDYDSLSFAWGTPLLSTGIPLSSYNAGYSYNSPLPGIAQDTNNIPATIDPISGQIHLRSYTTGAFVTSVKVTEYRCGIKIAEIWRDIQVVLVNTATNMPATIFPVFGGSNGFDTIVSPGTLLTFNISSVDFQFHPNGTPQIMYLKQFSSQFGDYVPSSGGSQPTLSQTTGCLTPPCATLTPASGPNNLVSGTFSLGTTFSWQTTCAHMNVNSNCANYQDTVFYQFLITILDDYCPVPAIQTKVIRIGVTTNMQFLPPPVVDSTYFDYNTLEAHIVWKPVVDSTNSFKAYYIYYSPTYYGTYTLIDSTLNVNNTSFVHPKGQISSGFYKIKTLSTSSCDITRFSKFSGVMSLNILGVDHNNIEDEFILYSNKPNPANHNTTLRFYTKVSDNVNIVVSDISGRIVEQKVFRSTQGNNSYNLSIKNLSAGVYYITLYYKEQKRTNKLMVK